MFIQPLPEVTQFIDRLNDGIHAHDPKQNLTRTQRLWLSCVLMGIIVTGQLCWASFARRDCFALYSEAAFRWIFRYAKLPWDILLRSSLQCIFKRYGITEGVLVLDDTDKSRSKKTTRIFGTHKVRDKKTMGYFIGQELIFMVLVTPIATIPIDFCFYEPDPKRAAWRQAYQQAKRQGIAKKVRPLAPVQDPNYPTKVALALTMIARFTATFPQIRVKSVLADALYGCAAFMNKVTAIPGISQVISQLRSTQLVISKGRPVALKTYFQRQAGVKTEIKIRGGALKKVTLLSARLKVKAQGQRRFVVALKYEGETEYRFLVASNLSWRHTDIVRTYTLRWLIEVFIEDWKQHGGWNQLTKHQGEDGSRRGVILSLLCDHCLLVHPDQAVRLENKKPGLPVGCLIERLKVQSTIHTITTVVEDVNPQEKLKKLSEILLSQLPDRDSSKHMAGLDLGRQDASESLKYRAAA
ncbi:MAG: transposase [Pseudomonadota bacterium]